MTWSIQTYGRDSIPVKATWKKYTGLIASAIKEKWGIVSEQTFVDGRNRMYYHNLDIVE